MAAGVTAGAATTGVTTAGATTGETVAARALTLGTAALRIATAGCFSSRSFTCRSFISRNDMITSDINSSNSNRTDNVGNDKAGAAAGTATTGVAATGVTTTGATAAGLTAMGATGAGATVTGAGAEVVASGTVCGVAAFSRVVPAMLVAVLPGCSTTAPVGVVVAVVSGWGSQASGWFSFCSKSARAAAWAGVSAARSEMKPAPRTMHKPRAILIFMKLSTFTRFCEHPRGQFNPLWAANAKQIF